MSRLNLEELTHAPESNYALGCIHSLESMGTVDGPGIRFVVFMQGCPLRCAYCHNPDTWDLPRPAKNTQDPGGPGSWLTVETIAHELLKNRAYYAKGGITVSGGEPLMQPAFVGDLFHYLHNLESGPIHTCLDTSGWPYASGDTSYMSRLLDATDMVLLDIKHARLSSHKDLCGKDLESVRIFGDELARRPIPVCIRHVVVPGITDTQQECFELGKLIGAWNNIVALELLPYHTMGINKYEQMGLSYRLAGVKQMDKKKLPELRRAVLMGIKEARS